MKTYHTPVKEIERKWYVVDAEGKVLGRLASEIATRLRGKHKPNFSSHMDVGDFIVVVNAEKVKLTGNKLEDKMYYHHSGYIGGLREQTAKEVLEKKPEELLRSAVKACCLRTAWVVSSLKSSRYMPAVIIPMKPSNQNSWIFKQYRDELENTEWLIIDIMQPVKERLQLPEYG
jgi:large subunit ribosomal protein L13